MQLLAGQCYTHIADQPVLGACAAGRVVIFPPLYTFSPKYLLAK